jgi:hypothetical protein
MLRRQGGALGGRDEIVVLQRGDLVNGRGALSLYTQASSRMPCFMTSYRDGRLMFTFVSYRAISGGRCTRFYCVVTSESFSTVTCSLDSSVETASSGISALGKLLAWPRSKDVGLDVREALDQSELADDLAALVGDVLLCGFELLLGGVLLEGDLGRVLVCPSHPYHASGKHTLNWAMLCSCCELSVCW